MCKAKERDTTYRRDQWIIKGGNHCPIKGEDAHAQASGRSKQGIDNNIVGSNPARPVEYAQSCEKKSRDPVPNEGYSHGDPQEALAGHVAFIAVAVVLVEGIEEGTTGQSTRPDHIWWPDDEPTKKSADTETDALRTNGEENLEGHGDGLAIEDTLCKGNMGWIGPIHGTINHDCNTNMLLYWKGARVEGPDITKSIEASGREDSCESSAKRKTHNLGNKTRDINAWI